MKIKLTDCERYPAILVFGEEEWHDEDTEELFPEYEIPDDLANEFLALHKYYWDVHEKVLDIMRGR